MSILPGQYLQFVSNELGERDAFHVPGIQVTSSETLVPGESIKFLSGTKIVISCSRSERHGIVDPFLDCSELIPGSQFWAYIKPAATHKLRHHWESDIIPSEPGESVENLKSKIMGLERKNKELDEELSNDECRGCW